MFQDFMKATIERTALLHWFLGTHLNARDSGNIGGPLVCSDCHQSQPQAVSFDGFCKNPFCSSHAKWAEAIEGYVPPENKFERAFAILDITHPKSGDERGALETHKKLVEHAFKGIPRTGPQSEWVEKANDWAQGG